MNGEARDNGRKVRRPQAERCNLPYESLSAYLRASAIVFLISVSGASTSARAMATTKAACPADVRQHVAVAHRLYKEHIVYGRDGQVDQSAAMQGGMVHELHMAQDDIAGCHDKAVLARFYFLSATDAGNAVRMAVTHLKFDPETLRLETELAAMMERNGERPLTPSVQPSDISLLKPTLRAAVTKLQNLIVLADRAGARSLFSKDYAAVLDDLAVGRRAMELPDPTPSPQRE